MGGTNLGAKRGELDIKAASLSAISDMLALSHADMIIGNLCESVFAQTAWLLAYANKGKQEAPPPFISATGPMCYYERFWSSGDDLSKKAFVLRDGWPEQGAQDERRSATNFLC